MRSNNKRLRLEKGYCSVCSYDFQKGGIIGYEIPGIYDGVLAWKCPKCKVFHYRFNKPPMTKKQFSEWTEKELERRGMVR